MAKTLLLVFPTVLEIFQQDLVAKTIVLVTPTELEIFNLDLVAKAQLLVTPTELEIFWPHFAAKALLLVTPDQWAISAPPPLHLLGLREGAIWGNTVFYVCSAKALTKQKGPNVCFDADKMFFFFNLNIVPSAKKMPPFCQHQKMVDCPFFLWKG